MATNTKNTPAPELYHYSYLDNTDLILSFKGIATPFTNLQLFDDKNKNGVKDAGEQLAATFTGKDGQWTLDVKIGQLTPESSFAFRSIENNGVNVSDIASLTYTTPIISPPPPPPPLPHPDVFSFSSNVTAIAEPNKLALTTFPLSVTYSLTNGTPGGNVQLSNLGAAKVGEDLQFVPLNLNVIASDSVRQSTTIQLDAQGSASFSLTALEDNLVEGDETLDIKATDLGNPTNPITAPAVVVHDSVPPPVPKITRDQSDIYEPLLGQSGTAPKVTQVTYTITGAANSVVNVSNKGSAKVGEDLSFSAQGVWSNGNVANQTATVKLNDKGEASFSLIALADNKLEADENVLISVADASTPNNSVNASAVVVHDTPPPQLKISADQTELFEPGFEPTSAVKTTQVNYSITNGVPNALVTLNNTGSAKVGDDLSVLPVNFAWINPDLNKQTVTIKLNDQGAANFSFVALADTLTEGDETLALKVADALDPSNAAAVAVTLHDTQLPSLNFSQTGKSVSEGNGGSQPVTLNVGLSAPSSQPVTVNYATANGSATAGSDYQQAAGTLTFSPGETSKTINVPIFGDTMVEPDETFTMTLASPSATAILGAASSSTVTIKNDDTVIPMLTFTDANAIATEGSSSNLTVNLSSAATQTITVTYQTNAGTATGGGVDYTDTTGTLTFAPGETSKIITVPIVADYDEDPNENFSVSLTSPSNNAILGPPNSTTVTIDDIPMLWGEGGFNAGVEKVVEGTDNNPPNQATVDVLLSRPAAQAVTVSYQTSNGTALGNGVDYTDVSGVLTFAPGETSKAINIPITGDAAVEPDENFFLNLFGLSSNATLRDTHNVEVTILNDDPKVFFNNSLINVTEGDKSGQPLQVALSLSSPSTQPVGVTYATSNGTAIASSGNVPGDYEPSSGALTFAPGETTKFIPVNIIDDLVYYEGSENFFITLTGGVSNGALGSPIQSMVTIIDNDILTLY